MKFFGYALVLSLVIGQLACKSDPGASVEDAKALLSGNWQAVEIEGNGGMKANDQGYLVHNSGFKMMLLLNIKGNEAKTAQVMPNISEAIITTHEMEIQENKDLILRKKENGLTIQVIKYRILKYGKDILVLANEASITHYKRINEDVIAKAQAAAQKIVQEKEEILKINRELAKGLEGKKLVLVGENGCTANLIIKESEKLTVALKLNGCSSEANNLAASTSLECIDKKGECSQHLTFVTLSEDKIVANILNADFKIQKSFKFVSVQ